MFGGDEAGAFVGVASTPCTGESGDTALIFDGVANIVGFDALATRNGLLTGAFDGVSVTAGPASVRDVALRARSGESVEWRWGHPGPLPALGRLCPSSTGHGGGEGAAA